MGVGRKRNDAASTPTPSSAGRGSQAGVEAPAGDSRAVSQPCTFLQAVDLVVAASNSASTAEPISRKRRRRQWRQWRQW